MSRLPCIQVKKLQIIK